MLFLRCLVQSLSKQTATEPHEKTKKSKMCRRRTVLTLLLVVVILATVGPILLFMGRKIGMFGSVRDERSNTTNEASGQCEEEALFIPNEGEGGQSKSKAGQVGALGKATIVTGLGAMAYGAFRFVKRLWHFNTEKGQQVNQLPEVEQQTYQRIETRNAQKTDRKKVSRLLYFSKDLEKVSRVPDKGQQMNQLPRVPDKGAAFTLNVLTQIAVYEHELTAQFSVYTDGIHGKAVIIDIFACGVILREPEGKYRARVRFAKRAPGQPDDPTHLYIVLSEEASTMQDAMEIPLFYIKQPVQADYYANGKRTQGYLIITDVKINEK